MNAKIVYPLLGALLLCNLYLIYAVDEVEMRARNAEHAALQAQSTAANVPSRLSGEFQQLRTQLALHRAQPGPASPGGGLAEKNMGIYGDSYREILLEDIALKSRVDLTKSRETIKSLWKKQTGREQPSGWIWAREPR